jgi:hypothetical protein
MEIDFNYAYNPYCAYNEDYSCPLPPRENWLKVAIRAGEKAFLQELRLGREDRASTKKEEQQNCAAPLSWLRIGGVND